MLGELAGRFGLGRALAAVLSVAALLLISAAAPAWAQLAGGSTALTAVVVTQGAKGETHLRLDFDQVVPEFSVVANDIDRPLLGFGDTVRGPGASIPAKLEGLVQGVDFTQRGAVLSVKIVGAFALHLETKTLNRGRSLDVIVTKSPKAVAAAPAATPDGAEAGPAGALPAHVLPDPSQDDFEIVPLRYADISEVVGLITTGQPIKPNDNFTPQEPAFGSQGLGGQGGGLTPQTYNPPGQEAAASTYGQMVDEAVGVDRRLNAIILHGPPDLVERLRQKIAQLDVPLKSVSMEAVFVELTEKGARDVGFDFKNSNGQIGVATYQKGSFVTSGFFGTPGAPLASYNLQAALYAEVSKGQGRIVSKPRISAQSGQSAKIVTGDALPILTNITLSGVNGVSQQVQYVNVGVTLQIAPRVSDDGYVTSKIFAEVSSVTGFQQGYPTISQREASTSATVKDGQPFVIGGLTQSSKLVTRSHVPGLGDVPLVGEFFKLHQETGAKTELYIVITPHIVREGDAAEASAVIGK